MSIVKKNNSDKYYVVLYCPDKSGNLKQRWISTGTSDEKKALKIEAGLKSIAQENKLRDRITSITGIEVEGLDLADAWDKYASLPEAVDLKANTMEAKQRHWKEFVNWMGQKYPVVIRMQDITRAMAVEYANHMTKKTSKQTFNNKRNNLRSVFKSLIYYSGLSENPFDVVLAKKGVVREQHAVFNSKEYETLNGKLEGDWFVAYMLGRYAAMSLVDVCNLKIEGIHFDADIISYVRSKVARYEKIIHVPMHPKLKSCLRKCVGSRTKGYLLKDFHGAYETNRGFRKEFGVILKDLKITRESGEGILGFDSLRHTCNTELERLGVEQGTRRKISGQSSNKVNDLYSHALDPLHTAVRKLT